MENSGKLQMKQGVRGLGVGRKRERRDLKEETGSTITVTQEKALSTNNVGKVVIKYTISMSNVKKLVKQ